MLSVKMHYIVAIPKFWSMICLVVAGREHYLYLIDVMAYEDQQVGQQHRSLCKLNIILKLFS